jgi:hypothetical protein
MDRLDNIFKKSTKQLGDIIRNLIKFLILHFDTEYYRGLESTLKTEWGSKRDHDAYKHL